MTHIFASWQAVKAGGTKTVNVEINTVNNAGKVNCFIRKTLRTARICDFITIESR